VAKPDDRQQHCRAAEECITTDDMKHDGVQELAAFIVAGGTVDDAVAAFNVKATVEFANP
jgi:hypothetical protein